MTDLIEQPIVSPEASAQLSSPADNAGGDDIDALMDQFTQADGGAPVSAEEREQYRRELAVLGERQEQFRTELSTYEMQRQEEQTKKDLADIVREVRGDLNSEFFDDGMVQAWIDNQARADTKLQAMWLNRSNEPAALRAAVGKMAKDFYKKYSQMPDPGASLDRESVTAAMMRGMAKAPVDPPPNYSRSSNREFSRDVQSKYGFDPGV
jgi:hypothetical protein